MKVSEKVKIIESNIAVENIVVKKFGETFEIYPWLKVRLFHKNLMGNDVLISKSKSVLISQIKSLTYGFFNVFRKYDAWIFTNSSERTLIEGKYQDKLFDYIGNENGIKTLVIELRLFHQYKRSQVASNYVISKSIFVLFEEIYSKFFLKNTIIENEDLILEIEKALDCKVNTQEIIKKNLAQYRLMKFWLSILPNPKNVFLTVHYSNFGYIQAFKERGIKVCEMQHGLIGEGHYAYLYEKALNPIQFPDEICVFGENESNFFKVKTLIPIKKVTPVGSFVLDHFYSKSIQNEQINKICVSLQDGDYGEKLLQFLLQANELLENKPLFIIQLRRTSEAFYREKFEFPDNFQFSTQTIYECISQTDLHLTIFSTTAIEALSIGKQNVLVNIEGNSLEFFGGQLLENEYTFFVNNIEEFCETINKIKFASKDLIANSNAANIKSDYKANIKSLIERINK